MAHKFRDYEGTVTLFENEAATGSEKRPVIGLAAAIVTKFTDMVTHLTTIAGGVATAATAALQTSANTKLDSIISALGSHLSTIASALANSGTFVFGQNTDIDAASEDLGSQAVAKGVWVKNISTAGQILYLSQTTATATNGWQLFPGETTPFPIECRNVSEIKAICSAANGSACWYGV